MISYASQLFTSSPAAAVAAHELAHQWWGDWVTPRTFADAWLSEGFATFSEAVWAEHVSGRAQYDSKRQQYSLNYFRFVVPREGVHPLYNYPRDAPMSNYPSTIYDKGAAVLVMLRHVLGDTVFFNGLRAYGAAHAYGNASTEDFRTSMENASGVELGWFFDQWVMRPGWPVYEVISLGGGSGDPLRLVIEQGQDTTRYPLFRMPMDVRISVVSGPAIIEQIDVTATKRQEFQFPNIPSNTVTAVQIDAGNYILKQATYRTVQADESPTGPSEGLRLFPAYPQPYSPTGGSEARLLMELRAHAAIRMEIHDTLGRMVYTGPETDFEAGTHTLTLPLNDFAAGRYQIRVSGGGNRAIQSLLVSR